MTIFTVRWELRRRSRWREAAALADKLSSEPVSLAERVEAREALLRFGRIVEGVGPRDRAAFVRRFVQGLELTEVAAAAGISLATTKRRLARSWARVALLADLDPMLSPYLGGNQPRLRTRSRIGA
jgi:RNA polymerase sigma-70 factor (ECF subfamily)